MKRINIGWSVAFLGSLAILLAIFSPVFLPERIASWVMTAFEPVCHQLPGRSPHVEGVQLAVCHRCLGIYSVIPIAITMFLFTKSIDSHVRKKAPYYFAISLVPIALDWGLDLTGIVHNTPVSRWISGAIFGLCAGYFLALGLHALSNDRKKKDVELAVKEL